MDTQLYSHLNLPWEEHWVYEKDSNNYVLVGYNKELPEGNNPWFVTKGDSSFIQEDKNWNFQKYNPEKGFYYETELEVSYKLNQLLQEKV